MVTEDLAVRAIAKWADMAMSSVLLPDGRRAYVIVPQGPRDREAFISAEAELIARGMELDWRHHPDELVRRTVADTLRFVAQTPSTAISRVSSIFGWVPDGTQCPVCEGESCRVDCPMRRVGVRPIFAAPSVVHMMGAFHA